MNQGFLGHDIFRQFPLLQWFFPIAWIVQYAFFLPYVIISSLLIERFGVWTHQGDTLTRNISETLELIILLLGYIYAYMLAAFITEEKTKTAMKHILLSSLSGYLFILGALCFFWQFRSGVNELRQYYIFPVLGLLSVSIGLWIVHLLIQRGSGRILVGTYIGVIAIIVSGFVFTL